MRRESPMELLSQSLQQIICNDLIRAECRVRCQRRGKRTVKSAATLGDARADGAALRGRTEP